MKKVLLKNGEEMAYRERAGGEQVVILLHGNMTSSKHWDLLMEVLDSKYKVYAPDLRGFGLSSYNERISSIKDFSDDIKLFVEALGLQQFSLVGWSTGGAVAMQFVIDNPGMVEKMVLVASASTRGYPMFAMKEDGTFDLERRLQTLDEVEADLRTIAMQGLYDSGNRAGLKAVWDAVIYTDKRPDEQKYEEYVDDMLSQRNLADVYHALNTFNISDVHNGVVAGSNQAKSITIPVLNLYGERDMVVTRPMTEKIIADLGETAIAVELKNTGHSPFVDDLQQVQMQIEKFLD